MEEDDDGLKTGDSRFGEEEVQEVSNDGEVVGGIVSVGAGTGTEGADITNKLPLLLLGADLGGGAKADKECYQEIEGGGWMVRIPFADESVEESGLRFRVFSATSELLFGKGGRMEDREEGMPRQPQQPQQQQQLRRQSQQGNEGEREATVIDQSPSMEDADGLPDLEVGEDENPPVTSAVPWWRRGREEGKKRGRRKKVAPSILRRRLDCQEFYDLVEELNLRLIELHRDFNVELTTMKNLSSSRDQSHLSLRLLSLLLSIFTCGVGYLCISMLDELQTQRRHEVCKAFMEQINDWLDEENSAVWSQKGVQFRLVLNTISPSAEPETSSTTLPSSSSSTINSPSGLASRSSIGGASSADELLEYPFVLLAQLSPPTAEELQIAAEEASSYASSLFTSSYSSSFSPYTSSSSSSVEPHTTREQW